MSNAVGILLSSQSPGESEEEQGSEGWEEGGGGRGREREVMNSSVIPSALSTLDIAQCPC